MAGADHLLPLDTDLIGDAAVSAFARKVRVVVDERCDAVFPKQAAAQVTVWSARGTWERYEDTPRGEPANALGRAGLQDKFRRLTAARLAAADQEAIIAAAADFRRGGHGRLMELVSAAHRPPVARPMARSAS